MAFSAETYAILYSKIKSIATGILSIQVFNGNTLKFALKDGSTIDVTIPNQLTTQQKKILIDFIPFINKFTENNDGELQYNSKILLTEENISLTQAKELIKILETIKIDTDNKAIINGVKLDVGDGGDLTLNNKKIMLKDDLPTPQIGDENKVLKVGNNLKWILDTVNTNNGIEIVEKYSDLPIGQIKDNIFYIKELEIIDSNTYEKGFYLYDANDNIYKLISNVDKNFVLKIWKSGENYPKDSYVIYNYKLYQAKVDIIGDLNFDENKYNLIIGNEEEKKYKLWKSKEYYIIGDKVEHDLKYYECIVNHTSNDNFEIDKNNWIALLEVYYSLTQSQYEDMISNGLINDANKHLYIIEDSSDDNNDNYEEEITVPSNIWIIQHNLNEPKYYKLTINMIDSEGNILYGDIDLDNTTNNKLIIKFTEPVSGIIYVTK